MRVTIVGGGIMGLSTAWGLSRMGHAVSVFEQGPLPNPLGSSVDQHRLIRYAYGSMTGYMRMVGEAFEAWDRMWQDLGQRLYEPTGTLVLDTTRDGWAQQSAEALAAFGLPVTWLSAGEVAARFPQLETEGVTYAFHLESGGVLRAGAIVEALASYLPSTGVRIVPNTRVDQVDTERARVTLASGARVEADVVVVAGGAWATTLLPSLAARVTPSRQVVIYLAPPSDLEPQWAGAPMVLDIAPDAGFYLVPPIPGTGLKIGDHRFRLEGDPDEPRRASEQETHGLVELCRGRVRQLDRYTIAGTKVCFYTVEPEERFLVEALGKAWVVSACSGHAFKFGSVIGWRLAETIDGKRDPWSLTRWAAGGA